jgi:DNA-binding MarR family transcriptional regulator
MAGSVASMSRRVAKPRTGEDRGQLSPCVCSTLRMVSRAVTQLYDDILRPSGLRVTQFSILATIARRGAANLRELEASLAIDQTTLTRSLGLLERDKVIERASHPDGRIKAMRLTAKGRRALEVARPLWVRAQDKVLRELGAKAWASAQRRLAHLLHVAVEKRRLGRSLRASRRRH